MFLRRQELTDLQPALVTLKAAADQDPDEWVRIVAAAVGPYDGVLHMDAVKEHSKLVRSTLEETRRHGTGADATLFRPLEVRRNAIILSYIYLLFILNQSINQSIFVSINRKSISVLR